MRSSLFKYLLLNFVWLNFSDAQNPLTLTFGNLYSPITTDKYEKAQQKINLQPGFKFTASTSPVNKLNLSISTYPTYVNSNYSDTTLNPFMGFNPSLVFGSTDGNYNVSPVGQFGYNIPVICSPGTNGIEPKLSISYNSLGVNSTMGVGFNLSGISVIGRTGANYFADGKQGGVGMNNQDFFDLDGTRLFLNSGTYGANGATYVFQSVNHQTITSIGNLGNGPQSFQVKDPKGFTIEYGGTAESRLIGANYPTVLAWYITKITDEFGNYMTYSYSNNYNGELLLDKIEYTGNVAANLNPYNKIQFTYIDRSDKNTIYSGDQAFHSTKLLKTITCTDANNSLVRKYVFEYMFNIYSLLRSVTEIGSDCNALNPTVFYWGEPGKLFPTYFGNQSFNNLIPFPDYYHSLGITAADLNGDGYSDLVGVASNFGQTFNPSFSNNIGPTQVKVRTGARLNNISQGQYKELTFIPSNNNTAINNETTFYSYLGSFVADEDRDGKDEVYEMAMHATAPNSFHYEVNRIKLFGSALVGGTVYSSGNFQSASSYTDPATIGNPSPLFFDIRDYNNDGINDMIIVDQVAIRIKPGLSPNLPTYGPETNLIVSPSTLHNPRVGDFDGDGNLEIIIFKYAGVPANVVSTGLYSFDIYEFGGTSSAPSINLVYSLAQPITKSYTTKLNLTTFDVGDFNGDGKSDIFSVGESAVGTKIYLSTGTSFVAITPSIPNNYAPTAMLEVAAQDLNGDNKSDVVIKEYSNFDPVTFDAGSSSYKVFYSFGSDVVPDGNTYSQSEAFHTTTFGDFNADGRADYFTAVFGNSPYEQVRYSHLDNQKAQFLTHIKSPKRDISVQYNFSKAAFDYNNRSGTNFLNIPLFQNTTLFPVYKSNATSVGTDLKVFNPSLNLVSTLVDNNKLTRYNYKNAVYNTGGVAPAYQFMGFETVISALKDLDPTQFSLSHVGSSVTTTFDQVRNTIDGTETINRRLSYDGLNFFNGTSVQSPASSNPYFLLKSLVLDFTNPQAMSKNTNSSAKSLYPTQNPPGAKIFYTDFVYSNDVDYLGSTNAATTVQIDNTKQGNPAIKKTASYQWGTSNIIRSTELSYNYVVVNGNYKTDAVYTNMQQGNDPFYLRSVNYTYDAAAHLTNMTTDANNAAGQFVSTTYALHNAFGAPTQITISGPDFLTRTSLQSFDATGRFVTQKVDAVGNIESAVYEPTYGNIVQNTNISGLVTKYKYDGLGRIKQTTLPNTAINKVEYVWETPFNGSHSVTAITAGAPTVVKYFDKNNNLLQTMTEGFNGATVISTNTYDAWDRMIDSYEPHFTTQQNYHKTVCTYFDPFYRKNASQNYAILNNSSPQLINQTIYTFNSPSQNSSASYQKGFTQVMQTNGIISTQSLTTVRKEVNEAGQVDKVANRHGAAPQEQISTYVFNSNGNPKNVTLTFPDNTTSNTQFTYDNYGRQISLVDQSAGTTQYQYNSLGQLTVEINPNGTFTYAYDNLDRKVSKQGAVLTTYQYVTAANGRQNIQTITSPNNTTEFSYDVLGRVTEQKETIGTKVLKTNYQYDIFGNITKYTFPNNFSVDYVYDNIGNQTQIKNGNTVLWQLNSEYAPGLIDYYSYNNASKTTTLSFNANLPAQLFQLNYKQTPSLYQQNFSYDASGDNKLTSRSVARLFASTSQSENFQYDAADRLTQMSTPPNTISYQDNGNIKSKTDAGATYQYNNTGQPYTLTNILNPTNNISLNTLNVQYNDLRKVSQISETANSVYKQMDFTYGNNDERCKVEYGENSVNQYTRYYAANYDREEKGSNTKEWDYVYAPTGLVAIYSTTNTTGQLLFVETDRQGSPLVITNAAGTVLEEYSFDAWGRRRLKTNWTSFAVTQPLYLIRGYTMHEHIDEFALINMNGRVYDPVLGRFLQPDNFVQEPGNLQNFNRYSYVVNNPLRYVDPTGDFFVLPIIGAVVGGYIGAAIQQGDGGIFKAEWNFTKWDKTWKSGFAVGAIIGAGVGLGISAGLAANGAAISYISPGVTGFGANGATTVGWNIVSNALITANVNIASRAIQDGKWNWKNLATSGLVGLGAGAIGGGVGSVGGSKALTKLSNLQTQNYVTSGLNGAGDRYFRSREAGLSNGKILSNTVLGGLEGLLMARVVNDKRLFKINVSARDKITHAFYRYATGFITEVGTSVPGVGFQVGSIYASAVIGDYFGAGPAGNFVAGSFYNAVGGAASKGIGALGLWDSYEQIGGFRPYSIIGH